MYLTFCTSIPYNHKTYNEHRVHHHTWWNSSLLEFIPLAVMIWLKVAVLHNCYRGSGVLVLSQISACKWFYCCFTRDNVCGCTKLNNMEWMWCSRFFVYNRECFLELWLYFLPCPLVARCSGIQIAIKFLWRNVIIETL